MIQYPALMDGEEGAYGIVFPDIPGVGAMGYTIDDAIRNAQDALQDYVIETAMDGLTLAVPSRLEDIEIPDDCILSMLLTSHIDQVSAVQRLKQEVG